MPWLKQAKDDSGEFDLKDLDEIRRERQEKKDMEPLPSKGIQDVKSEPPIANSKELPVINEEALESKDELEDIPNKQMAKYISDAGKNLADASLNIEKAISNIQKLILGLSSDDNKEIKSRMEGIVSKFDKISKIVKESSRLMSEYKDEAVE